MENRAQGRGRRTQCVRNRAKTHFRNRKNDKHNVETKPIRSSIRDLHRVTGCWLALGGKCGSSHVRRPAGAVAGATLGRRGKSKNVTQTVWPDRCRKDSNNVRALATALAVSSGQRQFPHGDGVRGAGRRFSRPAASTARAAAAGRSTRHHFLDIRTALATAQRNTEVDLKIFHRGGTGVETSLDLAVGDGFANADDHDENVKM